MKDHDLSRSLSQPFLRLNFVLKKEGEEKKKRERKEGKKERKKKKKERLENQVFAEIAQVFKDFQILKVSLCSYNLIYLA